MMTPRSPRVAAASIDWADLRRRVEAAGHAVAEGFTASPERTRELLEERARRLAQAVTPPAAGDRLDLITFALANETYAIEARYAWEVFRLGELTPLPGADSPIRGVVAWRGALLTILDLRPVLGLSVTALNDLSRVIVLGERHAAFGILADAVHDLVTVPSSDVRDPPHAVATPRTYLRGMTRDAVLVLDAPELLRLAGSDPA